MIAMTKMIGAVAALLVGAGAASLAGGSPAQERGGQVDAKALYTQHCQMCHGENGKAPLPEMSFAARTWKHGTKTTDMIKVITEGVAGTAMMPFKERITAGEIAALARLVRSFDPRLKPEKSGPRP